MKRESMTTVAPPNTTDPAIGDILICGRCGGEMFLYRTGPHPRRTYLEIQRFECRDCRAQFARTVTAGT